MPQRESYSASLLALACFTLFLFSRTTGDISIRFDDIFFINHHYVPVEGYFAKMGVRAYLTVTIWEGSSPRL